MKNELYCCDRFYDAIDDYVDAQLDSATRAQWDAHLAACEVCRAELDAQHRLLAMAKKLPRSIEPKRDLWPEIDRGISEPAVVSFGDRRAARKKLIPWLAPLLAAMVGILIAVPFGSENGSPVFIEETGSFTAVEQEYLDAKGELLNQLYAETSRLTPAAISTVEENLSIIENAIVDIRVALNEHPEDTQLKRILIATYKNQVDMLQNAVFLAHGS